MCDYDYIYLVSICDLLCHVLWIQYVDIHICGYLVSRLAGTNCIFIWHEARDEGGMRGTYLPLIPRPPPRPNLGRPV